MLRHYSRAAHAQCLRTLTRNAILTYPKAARVGTVRFGDPRRAGQRRLVFRIELE